MRNATTYSGIPAFILANATILTGKINDKLGLHAREDEDIFQELLTCGCSAQRKYRKGALSEKTFVYRAMERGAIDLLRRYNRHCRKIFLHEEQPQVKNKGRFGLASPTNGVDLPDVADNPDIVGQAHVRDVLASLSPLHQTIAELAMQEKSLSEMARALNMTIGAIRVQRNKMQAIVKNLQREQHDSGNGGEKF